MEKFMIKNLKIKIVICCIEDVANFIVKHRFLLHMLPVGNLLSPAGKLYLAAYG
jgi:hypothetical protein